MSMFTTAKIDEETRLYQEQTASIRFRQNLIHGVGAATVFGFATGMFGVLFGIAKTGSLAAATDAAATVVAGGAAAAAGGVAATAVGGAATTAAVFLGVTAATWAMIGIAVAVAVGFGCLYASSKLASQLVRIEQDHHAAQIAKGINNKAPAIEVTKPAIYTAQTPEKTVQLSDAPASQVAQVQLQDKVVPLVAAGKSADAAWTERTAANENQHATSTVRA